MKRGQRGLWAGLILLLTLASPTFGFPPQSIELLPGYKIPDSSSNGAVTGQLRYFVSFPSYYLATGIGIGRISAEANHQNLAIGSNLEMTPLMLAVKFTPPHPEWFPFFLEVGFNRLLSFNYQLDPSVNTGQADFCSKDISAGPAPCTITTLKKRSVAYHVGAGLETVFDSGFGIGLHYMYLFGRPLEQTIETTDAFGIQPATITSQDLFKMNMSVFSLLLSYHF